MTTANRPGLPALFYRVGTHATFLETMKARLSNLYLEIPEDALDNQGRRKFIRIYPLRDLQTRSADDPAIALLDSWAVVADVLTFYQERVANEGYLRTATERRSILELARLIGYALRPGVASTVYLAYKLDEDKSVTPPKPTAVTIPAGARAQSVPGPGELPQSFETSDDLAARSSWNTLQVRLTQPQTENSIRTGEDQDPPSPRVYLKGVSTNLQPNDPLLIDFGTGTPVLFRAMELKADAAVDRTMVGLQEWQAPATRPATATAATSAIVVGAKGLLKPLLKLPSVPPADPARLERDVTATFAEKSDVGLQILASFQPRLGDTLPIALAQAKVTRDSGIRVYALRVKAAPFGSNAPKRTRVDRQSGEVTVVGEWPIIEWPTEDGEIVSREKPIPHENRDVIYLDTSYDKIAPDSSSQRSWVVLDFSAWTVPADIKNPQVRPVLTRKPLITNVEGIKADISRADYGITGKTTRIELRNSWLKIAPASPRDLDSLQDLYDADFQVIRSSAIYAQSEELELGEEPINDPICDGVIKPIELNGFYSGLQSGRWLIVSGERTDIKNAENVVVPGVQASELVMLAGVSQNVKKIPSDANQLIGLPGDKTHTFIQLAEEALAYCYKRETVTIYGNVVKATHGETRNEVLGGGDGGKSLQSFSLRQPPLTFVSTANPAGVDSTLRVRVNDVLWHETDSFAGLSPMDRKFVTQTDDEGKTTVVFGNGREGARLPTGQENVKAIYRNGIGKPGNVKAGQITLLATRPLGVKEVTNPLRASGGADKENRDQARQNAPLAVMSLDRLVSTQDYADFARTFAGIGMASAVRLSDGRRQLVHVTVAGADDIPIEKTSDLYRNLVKALRDFGDPYLPIQVDVRELLALVISAKVRVLPDYLWEKVEPKIRTALLDRFSFDKRYLGQDAFLSEAQSAIQAVEGVAYVDVDTFDAVDEEKIVNQLAGLDRRERIPIDSAWVDDSQADPAARVRPAQLAYFRSEVPDTLILNEVTR
jgi:hypothetical protein